MKFYLTLLLLLIAFGYPSFVKALTPEEMSDCIDIAMIKFQNECRIPNFRVPCYNGTRFHRHDKSIHQISFNSLKNIAQKCCEKTVCNLNFIRSEMCCKKPECQQLCFGSGPPAHANTYPVKYILDMEIPQSLSKTKNNSNLN